ncbi:MAG TPA: phage tail tip lysozyme [Devosia sp.]|nr:phage tail tip lysozyme [Devosia sp.]
MNAEQVFRAKAPAIMAQLVRDFPITPEDAAAILGNLGHESAGLTILQEIKPTVPGSKGGYGWARWTGPRRRAYEAYCKRTGKDPASDDANYAYLFLELKGTEGSEGKAIGKLVAFERAFLRARVKHYPSRKRWAAIALDAWRSKSSTGIPIPNPTSVPASAVSSGPAPGGAIPIIVAALVLAAALAAFFVIRF